MTNIGRKARHGRLGEASLPSSLVGTALRAVRPVHVVALCLAFSSLGCGNAQQKSAYEHAVAAEQQHQQITTEEAAALIREYQDVIHLQPDSAWAKKARERIAALQTRVNADETHKSVFQEHGVD